MARYLLLAAGLCLSGVACSDDDDERLPGPPRPPSATGTLEYSWSINGRQRAEDCATVGAIEFESIIVDEGFIIDDVLVPCSDFGASLPLYTDDFLSRASLVDARRFPALGRIVEDIFEIEEGQVTTLAIDFPSAAVPLEPGAPDAGVPEPSDAGEADAGDAPVPDPPVAPDAGTDAGVP